LLQAMNTAGLEPVQALYLIWNQNISGTLAPATSDIASLAVTLRADFAAVEAQFALQDDPSGAIAQALMTLVYGVSATDFFFGLLNGSFSVSTPYAYAAATLPQSLIQASGGLLAYDDGAKQLSFFRRPDEHGRDSVHRGGGCQHDRQKRQYRGRCCRHSDSRVDDKHRPWCSPDDRYRRGAGDCGCATTTATSFTTATTKPHVGNAGTPFAIVNDPGAPSLATALANLEAAGQQAVAPFFATYPELQPLYAAYTASTDPVQTKRTTLLASFLPTLKRERKEEQALASITARDPVHTSVHGEHRGRFGPRDRYRYSPGNSHRNSDHCTRPRGGRHLHRDDGQRP
jgi:hypothetical protein